MEPIFILLSSGAVATLIYYKIPITTYMQIILFMLLLALLGYNRIFQKNKHLPKGLETKGALFIGSAFVQILVISTGGVFSPFFILIHLFTLTVSFLVNIKTSMTFVILSVLVLAYNSWSNPAQMELITNDPGTVLLYITSLIVIIPLFQIISSKYHLKEELSKILTRQVAVGGSIIESLSELVFVTNPNMQIVMANDAVEKNLKISNSEILNKNLLDVINLRDRVGQKASITSLSVDKVLLDKSTRIVSDFLLYTQNRTTPYSVKIQIRPVVDASGEVDQLSFVVTEGSDSANQKHTDLDKAQAALSLRLTNLKQELILTGFTGLETQLELIVKTEEDLLIAQELQDHPFRENIKLTDLALCAKKSVDQNLSFAKSLGVNIKFILPPEFIKENSAISLQQSNYYLDKLTVSDFAVPVDEKWVGIFIDKVLELAILLSSGTTQRWVQVIAALSNGTVNIAIFASSPPITEEQKNLLFSQYFGELAQKTNLRFGSGLEGFIVKTLSTVLNIPLQIELNSKKSQIKFNISVPQKPRP